MNNFHMKHQDWAGLDGIGRDWTGWISGWGESNTTDFEWMIWVVLCIILEASARIMRSNIGVKFYFFLLNTNTYLVN